MVVVANLSYKTRLHAFVFIIIIIIILKKKKIWYNWGKKYNLKQIGTNEKDYANISIHEELIIIGLTK